MEIETQETEKQSLISLIKNNRKIVIYIFTFLFFPLLISFLTVKYTDIGPGIVMLTYFTFGNIINVVIYLILFGNDNKSNTEDIEAIFIIIIKSIYVGLCFFIFAYVLYKPIVGNPIKVVTLKSNLKEYFNKVNYKYEPTYKQLNKSMFNELLKLKYITLVDKKLKFKSYNACLSNEYSLGIYKKSAKNNCYVYIGDDNYKISKSGSSFLRKIKHDIYIISSYENITNRKTNIKLKDKIKFKFISMKEDNLTDTHRYLHYTVTLEEYLPNTALYEELTNERYTTVKKIKLRMYYYRTFYGLGTNFKLKKIKIIN